MINQVMCVCVYVCVCYCCMVKIFKFQEKALFFLVYCESGKIRNEQSQTCEACPVGYYKTNTDYKFNNCTRCPENYVTPTTGSDDKADCTVRK